MHEDVCPYTYIDDVKEKGPESKNGPFVKAKN
jgi:hypothetical protein